MSVTAVAPAGPQPISAGQLLDITRHTQTIRETRPARAAMMALLVVLQELDIAVYQSTTVSKHQRHMQAATVGRMRRQMVFAAYLTGLLTVLYLVVLTVDKHHHIGASTNLWAAPLLGTLVVFMCWYRWHEGAYWTSYDLEEYARKNKLPDVVRDIAQSIERHPLATNFRLEALKTDPVLYVEHRKVSVCVAIWDKPGRKQPLLGQ